MNPYEWLDFSEISVIHWENICDAREHTTDGRGRVSLPGWKAALGIVTVLPLHHHQETKDKKMYYGAKPKCWFLVLCCQEHFSYMHSYTLTSHSVHDFYAPLYAGSVYTGQEYLLHFSGQPTAELA